MIDGQSQSERIAQQAFGHFSKGLATGEWQAFLEMLTDDFEFWFPVGRFQGWNHGKERAADFFAFASSTFKDVQVCVERVSSHDNTVVFEFRSQGELRGKPYINQAAVSFDIRGDKICSYREYLAVVVAPPTA